jgi:phosphate transport system substrate-binding protein
MRLRGLHLPLLASIAVAALAGCNPGNQETASNNAGENAAGANTGSPATGSTGKALQVKGSDTLLQLAQAWAEAFMQSHPDIKVSVSGGGSAVGFTSLLNNQIDIADASRAIEPKEVEQAKAKGINPVEHVVAQDALSIIVNTKNPIKELTLDQLADIYLGKTMNWKELGGPDQPILAAARDTSSGTYAFFKEHVLKKKDYAPKTLHLASNVAIANQVAQDLGSIGYVGLGYVKPGVRAISIKKDASSAAVVPSVANVLNKTYSLSRPLFEYTNGEPTGNIKTWLDFVQGSEGQKIVEQKEFVPVKKS